MDYSALAFAVVFAVMPCAVINYVQYLAVDSINDYNIIDEL